MQTYIRLYLCHMIYFSFASEEEPQQWTKKKSFTSLYQFTKDNLWGWLFYCISIEKGIKRKRLYVCNLFFVL